MHKCVTVHFSIYFKKNEGERASYSEYTAANTIQDNILLIQMLHKK